ncbi:hypothetical protein LCGC14_2729750 [marine sediment metagenome]|uniref:Uncharacterized protein n=1 Tax=marine sediment metagenome TaxID=412755 RepID=A0A0F8Z7M1_9ZZZZ
MKGLVMNESDGTVPDRGQTAEEELKALMLVGYESTGGEKDRINRFVDLIIDLIAERSEEKAEERVDQHERDYDHNQCY